MTLALSAQSQPPAPRPAVSTKPPQQQSATTSKAPDNRSGPLSTPGTSAPAQQPEQLVAKQNQRPASYWRDWLTNAGANWAIVVLTIALFGVGIAQWRATTTANTHNAVIERAYLDLSHVGALQLGATYASLSLTIKNNGRTPSDILGGQIRLAVNDLPPGTFGWVPLSAGPRLPAAFINPNDTLHFGPVQLPLGSTPMTANATVLVIGHIDYMDRFGGFHRSGYARQLITPTPANGNNLVFSVATAGLNYDRALTKKERQEYAN